MMRMEVSYPMSQLTVDVSNVFNEDMTLKAMAHAIASRIRASEWYARRTMTQTVGQLECELVALEDAGNDPWMFDEAWNHVYDMADMDHVLIITSEHGEHNG
jgi:hypothetical protein